MLVDADLNHLLVEPGALSAAAVGTCAAVA
jgi:hypothetical protein